ncbi:hypothetical protein FRB99_001497 [Tulasnella sp. 403]|nr:hypothetical protein FRB99_001497 [Tulasnella sp. 403]
MSVGYEHVHLPALQARNVKLGYTPDVLTDAVADVAIMLALMAGRNALQGLNIVQSGQWPSVGWAPFGFCGPQLGPGPTSEPFTAGFLGFGRISQATVHRLVPFGITHVIYSDSGRGPRNEVLEKEIVERYRVFGKLEEVRRVDIDELATQSDVIFLLAPGGESTYHIINRAFLHKMKKTAILVNPGRGTLVDSDALAEALNNDWLYAAALDVIEGEPNITKDHPLLKCPRATILPHVGSASTQARAAMADLAARNLIAGVKGEALITPLD